MGIEKFGQCLFKFRKGKGVSQVELAHVVHCDQSLISHYEAGDKYPSCPQLLRLADYFGIPLDALFDRDVSYGPPTEKWLERFTPATREFITNSDNVGHLEVFCQMAKDGVSLEELQQVANLLYTAKKKK
jgi:transcriptional regulator with XRE-family HTH domain